MTGRFDPAAFGRRLSESLGDHDVRSLQKAVAKRTHHARGTSYPNIWSYANGRGPESGLRQLVLEGIAAELSVLPEWLAYGEGPRTEAERATKELHREAAKQRRAEWQTRMRYVQDSFGEGGDLLTSDAAVRLVVLRTLHRLLAFGPHPRPRPYVDAAAPYSALGAVRLGKPVALRRESWNEPEDLVIQNVGHYLGRQLRAAFDLLDGFGPADLDDETFLDYVTAQCQSLMRLSDTYRRKPRPNSEDADSGD